MWYRHRTPIILQWLYPSLIWHHSRKEKSIYLTFDDGPIPKMTPLVLEILQQYDVKATFFCVGENVEKHEDVLEEVIKAGHQIGNHTYQHLDGWKTSEKEYLDNVESCHQVIMDKIESQPLFRPPYGKSTRSQLQRLKNSYKIIMWDVLSGDFDESITPESCLKNTIKATQNGSIVIFHDNLKAKKNLTYALPKYIEHCLKSGYQFKTL
jgi:peptidoglycan/xylan/chitin deacetylase (PgdA/CDA1 family)